eukprot:1240351-Rhodomonas_salina.2
MLGARLQCDDLAKREDHVRCEHQQVHAQTRAERYLGLRALEVLVVEEPARRLLLEAPGHRRPH